MLQKCNVVTNTIKAAYQICQRHHYLEKIVVTWMKIGAPPLCNHLPTSGGVRRRGGSGEEERRGGGAPSADGISGEANLLK